MQGKVQISSGVFPDVVLAGNPITVRFATSAPPKGKVMDIEYRRTGTDWKFMKKGSKALSEDFVTNKVGPVDFRVRMREVKNGSATAWSPFDSATVN